MLPRKYRLTKSADVSRAFRIGRSYRDAVFGIKVAQSKQKRSRFAFVVSTKVSKKATVRNTLKRRMREAVRPHLGSIKLGYDVVVTAFASAVGRDFKEVKQRIEDLLIQSGIIDNRY